VRKGSKAFVRDLNRSAILRLIGRAGPIARNEIARELQLSPATVTNVTRELVAGGLVKVVDQAPSRGGRPALLLGIVGAAAQALGVKVAPDHLVGVRVNLDAEVLERFELPFDAAAADAIEQLTAALRPHACARPDGALFLGVGLGVPGIVDRDDHSVVDSPMLGWRRMALGEHLQHELGVPVLVENDVNTLAVAERLYGRGRELDNFVTVTIGRGIGLGIIAGGDLYRGARGGAGEFGHVAVAPDGPLCECGRRGCLEALVADPALVQRAIAEEVLPAGTEIDDLRTLAADGHLRAVRIFADAGATLGRAVAGLVNILSPELVLISGEGTQAWPHMAASFEREFANAVFAPLGHVSVEIDPWDDAKWARGAAALVLRATLVTALEDHPSDFSVRARLKAGTDRDQAVAL
jgi:predicted NBD/HSP70 family sugar kinase